uniref:Cell wall hydrolase SleB domain-containing protein n=1 Tax=Panagrolaimus sp. PS1159 TaxID=55785 RepID=A0AC35EYG1_9BILA
MANLDEREVFKKTIYAEARGEPEVGQQWVAWVIKNRAYLNRSYWGGSSIKAVCLHPNQFECWKDKSDIEINEPEAYHRISKWADAVYDAPQKDDPTGGCDHYNNPSKEKEPG